MKAKLAIFLASCVFALWCVAPAGAHHSVAAVYDVEKVITLTGVVSKLEWMNPHTYLYVDAKDDKGTVATWSIETDSPNSLTRHGWKRDSLKPGDTVTATGSPAKDGSKVMRLRTLTNGAGEKLHGGLS